MNLSYEALSESLPQMPLLEVDGLPWPKTTQGKVRDIFDLGDAYLIVASDRISAFDVVLPNGIPGKGILLTQISLHWFAECSSLVDNHLVEDHNHRLAALLTERPELIPRSMLVRKMSPFPIEAVVRKYLAGSGWKHYLKTGTLFGLPLPQGLRESDKLPAPLFTPTTKAQQGAHDEPIDYDKGIELIGASNFEQIRDVSLKLFALGSQAALQAGLILADTKFEFGTDPEGQLHLIDEVLTPDSSRYWPLDDYEPGRAQTAFDKQYVRDYLESLDWDKTAPGPELPQDVVAYTQAQYLEAYRKLTGA